MKCLVLRVNTTDYFLKKLEDPDFYAVYDMLNLLQRGVRFILVKLGIPYSLRYGKWKTKVKEAPFYHRDNICILGEDDMERIREFLEKPFHPIQEHIVDYYDYKNWRERFQ